MSALLHVAVWLAAASAAPQSVLQQPVAPQPVAQQSVLQQPVLQQPVAQQPVPQAPVPPAEPAAPPVVHDAHATFVPAPPQAEIGEPVEWLLDVEHAADARVKLPEFPPEARAFAWLGERSVTRGPDPANPARAHTIVRWHALALDAGELTPPALELEVVRGTQSEKITAAARSLAVRGALAADEDSARPLRDFRDASSPGFLAGDERVHRLRWIAAGSVALLALAVALLVVRRAHRRRAIAALPPTPLARCAEIARVFAEDPERTRRPVYEVTRLLRDAVDEFLGVARAGLTDAEWVAAIEHDERVPAGVRSTSARLLASAEAVKYALASPTRFAVDQLLADARGALEALAAAPKPAPLAPVSPPPAPAGKDKAA